MADIRRVTDAFPLRRKISADHVERLRCRLPRPSSPNRPDGEGGVDQAAHGADRAKADRWGLSFAACRFRAPRPRMSAMFANSQ